MTAENSGGEQRLECGILGPLEVVGGGARLRLGGRQQRAILGLLLCEAGQVVSTGRLADALWGEQLPASYLTTVQTYIFHLRELLEPGRARGEVSGVLVSEPGGGYRLHVAKGSVDARLFEELLTQGTAALEGGDPAQALGLFDRALGLWRGEVLGDLADFAFVAPVAGRLHELRLAAMESRMEAELALGHHGAAVAELDRLVAEHPLRERLHAERILALYRSGRQSDALGAYRSAVVAHRGEYAILRRIQAGLLRLPVPLIPAVVRLSVTGPLAPVVHRAYWRVADPDRLHVTSQSGSLTTPLQTVT